MREIANGMPYRRESRKAELIAWILKYANADVIVATRSIRDAISITPDPAVRHAVLAAADLDCLTPNCDCEKRKERGQCSMTTSSFPPSTAH